MHRLLAISTTIGGSNPDDTPFSPATNFPTFGSLVSVVVSNAIMAAGVIAFIFIILGGFGIIKGAGGDPKKLQDAKKKLTMAVVGLLIVVFSLWIVRAMEILLGIKLLSAN
jgi:hypothetical protein